MLHFRNNCINDAVAYLKSCGFVHDFSLIDEKAFCAQLRISLHRNQFRTVEMYFYPAEDHTTVESMVYAIRAQEHEVKGLLVIKGLNNNIRFLEMATRKDARETSAQ